jgi:glycosyltransferase involved in cell wall biosynthesis
MKILIFTEYFFPIPGGVQTIVSELARGLAEWGTSHPDAGHFEVTVVTRTRKRTAEDESWPFRLVRCPDFWRLLQLLRASDVIHLAGPAFLPLLMALLLAKPVVIEHHGFHAACPNGLLFFEPAQAPCPGHFMAKRYGQCLACNRSAVGTLSSLYWLAITPARRWLSNRVAANITPTNWLSGILKLNRTTTIYHGISNETGSRTESSSNSAFAFQGRFVTTKGANLLIKAVQILLKEHPDLELKMIGDGPELPSLKSQIADLDGHVKFLGHVADAEMNSVLSGAATVVMPSVGGEVFGLVAAENMMRGKLLIVSDIGALVEVVGDTGLVFPAKDAKALASCMRQVLENPTLAPSLGAAARERAMQVFNRDSMIQAHVRLYQGAVHH